MRETFQDDWFVWATSTDPDVVGAPLRGADNQGCQYLTLALMENRDASSNKGS